MGSSRDEDYRVVYTTEVGALCPKCKQPKAKCSCARDQKMVVRGDGNVRIRRETSGRGGKTVTTIDGLALNQVDLEAMLKEFKRLCGAGGALKDGVLEIQGDHCAVLLRELERRGIKAKRAGG